MAIIDINGMLKKIKKLLLENQQDNLVRKADLQFGEMRFIQFKDKSKQYWECEGIFKPTGVMITFLIENSTKEGPDEKQRDFYLQIVRDFDKISMNILQETNHFLDKTYANYIPATSFDESFQVKTLSLFIESLDPTRWDFSFSPKDNGQWFYITAHMKGNEVIKIEVES